MTSDFLAKNLETGIDKLIKKKVPLNDVEDWGVQCGKRCKNMQKR